MVGAGALIGGRYRLRAPIASGGMAQVWEALDETLTRPVAVKVLHANLAADEGFVARFRAEAINAARLSHPAIVSVYDTCSEGGIDAIVMELVRGTTLRRHLDRRRRLDPDDVVAVGAQVAAALDHAHTAGIIHRDVKPANILLSDEGRVLVTDFGIAKATEGADLTTERSMLGTAKYLAPEQVEGATVDARTDVYALGVVLYEALTGEPPFTGDSETATALARLHRPPRPLRSVRPELSASLDSIVTRCLERYPGDRPPTAANVRTALLAADTSLEATRHVGPAGPVPFARTGDAGEDPGAGRSARGPSGDASADPDASHQGPPAPHRRRTRRRRLPVLVGALVVAGALVLATLLSTAGRDRNVAQASVSIAGAAAYDPYGKPAPGQEHNAEARLAVDGNNRTAWTTERYRDTDITNLKPGVGLVIRLRATGRVNTVRMTSSTPGWSFSLYGTADTGAAPPGLPGWAQPITPVRVAPGGTMTVPVDRDLGALLIWITRTGPDHEVRIEEVTLS
ncbi:MAG: serine/threonine protein kinase [Actinobacteria bacterium]|nr:serine/threonine protein kinase [Actinomycetota bacterium]